VWPHDTAICIDGLTRYGFTREAQRIASGLLDAAQHVGHRLPELFAGFPRAAFPAPVPYPTSCSPQAWAAASPLLFLRTLLRFEPDIRANKLHLAPAVPDWIGTLRLERIPIMGGHLGVEVTGEVVKALEVPEDLTIVSDPRRPTIAL
jgi:glycogen debranching enzyme